MNLGPERAYPIEPAHRVDRVAQQHHRDPKLPRDQQRGAGETGMPDRPVRPVAPGCGVQPPAQHPRLGARASPPAGHQRQGLGPEHRVPVRREQRAREPAQIPGRAEQPSVPAHPAKRERVAVVHLPPHHARAGPLVAVGLGGRDALPRHPRQVPGRSHPERPEYFVESQVGQRLARAFLDGPAQQHESQVAVADLTGHRAGQLRDHRLPDLGRPGAGGVVGPVRDQPGNVQQALADGDR